MILFSSDLELILENKIIMNKLIIDLIGEKFFLMIITNDDIYNITKENTKINYEKLTLIINDFLNSQKLTLKDISKIYLNRGQSGIDLIVVGSPPTIQEKLGLSLNKQLLRG